jgi:sensor histidine kinase YesM
MKKPNLKFFASKLRTKLFISYLLFIGIVAASNLAIYKIYENNTVRNIEETSTGLVQQLSNNISYKLSSLELGIFYATDASQIFSESDYSDYISVKKKVEIFNIYLQSSGAAVHSDLFLKFKDNSYYYNGKNHNDCKDTNIFNYVQKNRQKIIDASGKAIYAAFEDEPGIVYIIKTDITIDTHKPDGIVAIGISDSYFTSLAPKSLSTGSIIICDHDSNILICDNSVREIVNQFNKSGQENVKGQSFYNYKSDNMIIESCYSEDARWKVLYVISLDDLLSNTESIKKIVFLLCIILLAFSLIIAFVISDTLTANLRLLLKKIKLVENGHFTEEIMPKSRDETSELFNHFNIMSNKLNDLVNRIAYEKSECRRAEYNALLAQINPHFLFNVLESINGIAKIKGQDDIVKIISSLSFLMRIILGEKNRLSDCAMKYVMLTTIYLFKK